MNTVPKRVKPARSFLIAAMVCYGMHVLGFFAAILAQPLLRGLYGVAADAGASGFYIPYATASATIALAVFFALTALYALRRVAEPDKGAGAALALGAVFAGVSAVVMPIVNLAQNMLTSVIFSSVGASSIGVMAASMSAVSGLQSFFHVFALLGTFALLIACAMIWQEQRGKERKK